MVVANRSTYPDAAYDALPHFFNYAVQFHGSGINMTDILDDPTMMYHTMVVVPGVVSMPPSS